MNLTVLKFIVSLHEENRLANSYDPNLNEVTLLSDQTQSEFGI
jgi:hypothetical protein